MTLTDKQRNKFIEEFRKAYADKNYRQVKVLENSLYALGVSVEQVTEVSQLGWRFAVLRVA